VTSNQIHQGHAHTDSKSSDSCVRRCDDDRRLCLELAQPAQHVERQRPPDTGPEGAGHGQLRRVHALPRSDHLPDPTTSPHEIKPSMSPNSTLTRSPRFQSAATVCQHLLPDGSLPTAAHSHAQIVAFLAFARCIRTHGFPNFPDPTSSGQMTHQMLANAGVKLHQPAVLQAGDACVGVTHGVITKAAVARFVAGQ
jgi:hypothetical protein